MPQPSLNAEIAHAEQEAAYPVDHFGDALAGPKHVAQKCLPVAAHVERAGPEGN